MDTVEDHILLILDLDETLIFASEERLERDAEFRADRYHVYRRPHLTEFLILCHQQFQIAVWSASGANYLAAVVETIFPADISPVYNGVHLRHGVHFLPGLEIPRGLAVLRGCFRIWGQGDRLGMGNAN